MRRNIDNFPEVIRVLLDTKTFQTLHKDMDLFEINKIGTFVNRIIVNFYPKYERSSLSLIRIKNVIKEKANISETNAKAIAQSIFDELGIKSYPKTTSEKAISIRPNVESKKIFTLHTTTLDENNTFSVGVLIKNMLLQYAKLSRVEREIIVFRKEIEVIEGAIQSRSKLMLEFNSNLFIFHPTSILELLDDYGNYLLGYNEKTKKDEILLIRKITQMYPNGDHFIPSKKIKKISEIYRNKVVPFLSENEISVLKILLNKKNLEPLYHFLTEYEKNSHVKFDRSLSDKTINSFLPALFTIESNVDETEININIKDKLVD